MAINVRLQELLDRSQIEYETIPHRDAFSAKEVAFSAHVPGRQLAKVVVIRDAAKSDFMVVIPASDHVDDSILHRVTSRKGTQLEKESELKRLFPDCEVGAMPPFGKLYGLAMYVDACLAEEEDIWFQAGNHHELVRMRFRDFARIAQPFYAKACLHPGHALLRR